MSRLIGIFSVIILLNSCSLLQPSDNPRALCKELKHRIIFSGATTNPALAAQQRAEMEKLNEGYNSEGCENY